MKTSSSLKSFVVLMFIFIFVFIIIGIVNKTISDNDISFFHKSNFRILSSYENADLESQIVGYAKSKGIQVSFTYKGDLEIVDELNDNSSSYDAVWISNSIWLYMLDNTYTVSNSKSISISPVVMGIRKNKAASLGLIGKDIYNRDLLQLIKNKQIKYVMSSVTQTNTGATAYLGFLNTLAGSPEVLTTEMLDNTKLIDDMIDIFSGVERVSGDESYLETMFLNSDDYEAVIASESSLININKKLKNSGKEELYLLYPVDGVAINDSTFAYIDNKLGKSEDFKKIQNYLLSTESQEKLLEQGRRTWYGGTNNNSNKEIFNPDWGIDTNKYLITTKYPSKKVMTKAIGIYIESLRKPTHVVFCLDYSGSMSGSGVRELRDAMEYILDYDQASKSQLQFSKKDKITVITFGSKVTNIWNTDNGLETANLISKINSLNPDGTTALYDAVIAGMDILAKETDDYTKTIIAMTDGAINVGTYSSLASKYNSLKEKIPVYSITFGAARESELDKIANLTNAKVFNGKSGLLQAFKEVRGYN